MPAFYEYTAGVCNRWAWLLMVSGSQSPSVPPRYATLYRRLTEVGAGVFQGHRVVIVLWRCGCVTRRAVASCAARCFRRLILSVLSISQLRGWRPSATKHSQTACWLESLGHVGRSRGATVNTHLCFVCLCVYVCRCVLLWKMLYTGNGLT